VSAPFLCGDCCTCPAPAAVVWDSVSAGLSKCGAINAGAYYRTFVRCASGRLTTTQYTQIGTLCLLETTTENDIRCCTTLFIDGGKRWAKRTTVETYTEDTYTDTRDDPPFVGSGYEDTGTVSGSLTTVETRGADCTLTCAGSGVVTWSIERKGYYRDELADPWVYDSLDRTEGSLTRNTCSSCTFFQTRTTFSGGFSSGNTEEDATTTPEGPTSGACSGVPSGATRVETITYADEVAAAPAPSYSDEYTTADLRTNVLAILPDFDDDWNDTAGSGANVASGEASILVSKSRYRIPFPLPRTLTGKCYRANWVERFIAEGGVGIDGVTVIARGRYRPLVTISGGGGTGAVAVAVMSATGTVSAIRILNPGTGYTSAPSVFVQAAVNGGTNSTGWTATVAVGIVVLISGGSGGNYRPTLSFTGGGGSGATAALTMDEAGGIAAVNVTASGSGYTAEPTALSILSRTATSIAADLVVRLGVETAKCKTWDGTTLAGKWFTRVVTPGGHPLTSIEVAHGGSYKPFVVITGGGSSARGAVAVVSGFSSDGRVTAITILDGGTGYTSAPAISLPRRASGAHANDATATATVSGGAVTGITIVTEGNYLPTLSISGGGGTGATGTVAFDSTGAIASVTLTAPGTGYTSNPNLVLSYYGTANILLAAHFGTEVEYPDGSQPPGATPVGYVEGVPRTYPILGELGTAPWKYFELGVPATDGNASIASLRASCDCAPCP